MNYPLYNLKNEEIGTVELSDDIFNVGDSADLTHQMLVGQMANARKVLAHTKGRGEVRGGGVKPWRQKGTGRARHGSIRSPIWIGGGVTFGPTKERNFSQKLPKKMRQKALKIMLSLKANDGMLKIIDKLSIDKPKTKEMSQAINGLFSDDFVKAKKYNNMVLVLTVGDSSRSIAAANRNLPYSKTLRVDNINTLDVASYKYLLMDKDGLSVIEKKLATGQTAKQL